MQIITDNKWREFKYSSDVPDKEWISRFDHLDRNEATGFFCYRGAWYSLDEFLKIDCNTEHIFHSWDGYLGETFFSGLVIEISKDGEMYKIGRFWS